MNLPMMWSSTTEKTKAMDRTSTTTGSTLSPLLSSVYSRIMVEEEPPAPAARGELGFAAACCAARRLLKRSKFATFARRYRRHQEAQEKSEGERSDQYRYAMTGGTAGEAEAGGRAPQHWQKLTEQPASSCSPKRRGLAVRQWPLRQTAMSKVRKSTVDS